MPTRFPCSRRLPQRLCAGGPNAAALRHRALTAPSRTRASAYASREMAVRTDIVRRSSALPRKRILGFDFVAADSLATVVEELLAYRPVVAPAAEPLVVTPNADYIVKLARPELAELVASSGRRGVRPARRDADRLGKPRPGGAAATGNFPEATCSACSGRASSAEERTSPRAGAERRRRHPAP